MGKLGEIKKKFRNKCGYSGNNSRERGDSFENTQPSSTPARPSGLACKDGNRDPVPAEFFEVVTQTSGGNPGPVDCRVGKSGNQ
jgi:hypothetical protein